MGELSHGKRCELELGGTDLAAEARTPSATQNKKKSGYVTLKRDAVATTNNNADEDLIPLTDCDGTSGYREGRKGVRRLTMP